MSEWTPKPRRDLQLASLRLSGEEGFVLAQVDGATSVKNLVHVTGLPEGKVRQILDRLVHAGAVEGTSSDAGTSGPPLQRASHAHAPARAAPVPSDAERAEIEALLGEATQDNILLVGDPTVDDEVAAQRRAAQNGDAQNPQAAQDVQDVQDVQDDGLDGEREDRHEGEHESEHEGEHDDERGDERDDGPQAGEGGEGSSNDEHEEDEATQANHRKLYNETLSKLEPGLREAMAQESEDPELAALCFDPLPAVIKGIVENSHAGFSHARLIARHHMTPQGLEHVMARAEFLRDAQTQRLLLQSNMLQEAQLKRILQPRRLSEVYKVTISREVPERTRQKARHVLRNKWAMCEAEERAGLVFLTEGRCLAQLTGLPFDSRTTSMLCGKSYTSNLLIQNLARFGATPPPVLAHLLKQNTVRRQPMLRNLVLQHPNCPADAKRKV